MAVLQAMTEPADVILEETEVLEVLEETEYIEDEVEETEYLEESGELEEQDDFADINMSVLKDVQERTFDEVRLPEDVVAEVSEAWTNFINSASSREAAGEAIFAAIFDSAPSLQNLFKIPRAIMAMRFVNALNSIISAAGNPSALKIQVETLGFQHLDIEVTVPRVVVFRDAIIEHFEMELAGRFSSKAKIGLAAILNYVGGAFIYIRREYSGRIKVIQSSWKVANNRAKEMTEMGGAGEDEAGEEKEGEDEVEEKEVNEGEQKEENENNEAARSSGEVKNLNSTKVPTTFNEMFMFNGAVMDFGNATWMNLVLAQFDAIVTNVANSYRLQEECDVLSLVLAKYNGTINLSEFKAVMLSSLRSLVPKDWDTNHEVAWNWLWGNVERMLTNLMGKPALMEKALETMMLSMTEDDMNFLRREMYKTFFTLAPAGQDYFKQSTTRLYWIADKWFAMTYDIYREPKEMVDSLSALGLRHVGYDIPTEFFAPFVAAAVEVVRQLTSSEEAAEAFRWSLTLISKILVRTVLEGSTIVMKAINTNQESSLQKAIAVSPRGKRSLELLNITVGTQSISPFYWSIESGALNCARAMILDLLTIRADRDNYYYGYDDLFSRHPEVIQRLSVDAAPLLWPLMDGLIWRSRLAFAGKRRVNYYVKHLIQDSEGRLNKALEWLAENQDAKLITHPTAVLFADIIWSQAAARLFLLGRIYSMFILAVFVLSQVIIYNIHEGPEKLEERIAIFACRIIVYIGSMCRICYSQVRLLMIDVQRNDFKRVRGIPIPMYLTNLQEFANLCLFIVLLIMASQEPIFLCTQEAGWADESLVMASLFTESCDAARSARKVYSVCSCIAMGLYFVLLTDCTIFSMSMSAFLLVCARVASEIGLFLLALAFLVVSFSSGMSCLDQEMADFETVARGMVTLLQMALAMYPSERFLELDAELWAMITVAMFLIIVGIFLTNLLIAQLNQAYQTIFRDMEGFARLNRAAVTVKTLEQISDKRWAKFLSGLKMDERLEFNEGDVGVAGGLQVLEAANLNPTTVDAIRRFGGSTSPAMPWPEEGSAETKDGEQLTVQFERLEKLIMRVSKPSKKARKEKDAAGIRRTRKVSSDGDEGDGSRSGLSGSGLSGSGSE
eukprot:TRINITY_DN5185_c0_g1_i1.p1 TRINITY_DN5185_c0_g1~~TRINITY_DN5185_c0_g1_i1.p1  ORF type:complete len:1127 (+),score=272.86 TRINITY_DN5185_c0_g1_i1:63-3443(+)